MIAWAIGRGVNAVAKALGCSQEDSATMSFIVGSTLAFIDPIGAAANMVQSSAQIAAAEGNETAKAISFGMNVLTVADSATDLTSVTRT